MNKILEWIQKLFNIHSPCKGRKDIYKKENSDCYRELDIPTKAVLPPNLYRSYLDLDPIIPVDEDKQIIKIVEGKSVIIQFDRMMKPEAIKQLEEVIKKQIKENGFAVVDGRCKIVEFDNPKYLIETK